MKGKTEKRIDNERIKMGRYPQIFEKLMTKRKIFILIGLFIIVVATVVFYFRPVIWLSKEQIYGRMLKYTPIGCDKRRVLEYVKEKDYEVEEDIQDAYDRNYPRENKIGSSYIRVYLGHYQGIPWRCDVTVFWIFDKDKKLIHIDVWKSYDAL